MLLHGRQLGEQVPGTDLLRHGRAQRRSATDRSPRAWFECLRCGEFLSIRISDVRPGHTVSCGCKGKALFIAHYEQRAANLPARVVAQIFRLAYHKKRSIRPWAIACKLNLPKYVIHFVIAAKCRQLEALAETDNCVWKDLTSAERRWINRFRWRHHSSGEYLAKEQFVASLLWWDRAMYEMRSCPGHPGRYVFGTDGSLRQKEIDWSLPCAGGAEAQAARAAANAAIHRDPVTGVINWPPAPYTEPFEVDSEPDAVQRRTWQEIDAEFESTAEGQAYLAEEQLYLEELSGEWERTFYTMA